MVDLNLPMNLGSDWFTVPGFADTNQTAIPADRTTFDAHFSGRFVCDGGRDKLNACGLDLCESALALAIEGY